MRITPLINDDWAVLVAYTDTYVVTYLVLVLSAANLLLSAKQNLQGQQTPDTETRTIRFLI